MSQVTPAVTGRGVELRFGETIALDSSDFIIPAAGVTALIGPNGSGKSTVLAAIAGLHKPASGEITVMGLHPSDARPQVSFVPQGTKVNDALPVTVGEVVAMGRYASLGLVRRFSPRDRDMVESAMTGLDLQSLATMHLRELSGGQRQRVFVAQGLVQDWALLLMDEPTTALDLVSARMIHEVVERERSKGRPVVISTHDLADARIADHVILLAGRVVAEGPPGSVLTPTHMSEAYRFDAGQLHIDDAAHAPTAPLHHHVEPRSAGRERHSE